MNDLIIVGAGGFGWEVAQYARDMGIQSEPLQVKGFLDDDPAKPNHNHHKLPILGNTRDYPIQSTDRFLISVGDPAMRREIQERLRARGATFASLVHPRAYVSPSAKIGSGCIIAPFATVGSYACLEDHVLLNIFASAGHDTHVGSFCVLSPYAVVSGSSVLEDGVFVGAHGVVTPDKRIGSNAQVAAGAVVYRDLPSDVLAVGNPAKAARL
jgi:sugar O-acyltransferase (sialic acid O-acetyltransferase NeuD family)